MLHDVPTSIQQAIVKRLSREMPHTTLTDFTFVGGGCINHSGQLKTSLGNFFLKWNDARGFPGMLQAEAKGLSLLEEASAIQVPEIIAHGETDGLQFLVLEYIQQTTPLKNYWHMAGEQLANLHENTSQRYGLDHDNYIGALQQFNTLGKSWVEFFIDQRLAVQVKLAVDTKRVEATWAKKFDTLYTQLPSLLPEEKPALLHGDLWHGNIIVSDRGGPCLVDPAVYFGHREIELAMTHLFGGFDNVFYQAYHSTYPLQPDFDERVPLYNLYPLLVHLNLFGASYRPAIDNVLNMF